MDDAFLGSSDKWGIVGVFMNLEGKVMFQFRKNVKVELAVHE